MKILLSNQIYEADKVTISQRGIASTVLMEEAAYQCFNFIKKNYDIQTLKFNVFCGVGNNGGDGLVIARYLKEINADVTCYIVYFSENQSVDFKINLEKINSLNVEIRSITDENKFPIISSNDFIIDAIFGVGLKKAPSGFTQKLIQHLNNSKAFILSIDLPSGLRSEEPIIDADSVIRSAKTLTFQSPKLALLLPNNKSFCSDFEILEIGLDSVFINNLDSTLFFITKKDIQQLYQPRNKFDHKGNFGHSLLIGGSFGKIGAITLASKAALKIGSGLVSCYLPKCGYPIIQTTIPEVMTEVDDETEIHHFNFKTKPTVIGVGPGLGLNDKTVEGFLSFLKLQKKPLVIDADALNILSQNKSFLKYIPKNSVITPHPKEFERLVGKWKNDFEKLDKIRKFSIKYKIIVILKGAYTIIADHKNIHFNSSGNTALATAGSGDVLTGIITGLIAQGYSSINAALLGVYLHGLTADIYTQKFPQETFVASDIINLLPEALIETISS